MPVRGRTVVLVDDGIATGSSAVAAARILRRRGAAEGGSGGARRAARRRRSASATEVDEFVCLESPEGFFAVGACYERSGRRATRRSRSSCAGRRRDHSPGRLREPADGPHGPRRHRLGQDATAPRSDPARGQSRCRATCGSRPPAIGLVIFAHGSGSSRLSPRNIQVAAALNGGAVRHSPVRSPDRGRGARQTQRLRHRPARRPPRGRHALGAARARASMPFRSATSAPPQERPPPSAPPLISATASGRWSRVGGGRIWPGTASAR